ncbi:hypothetical protein [Bradyrhizobium sp. McL0616]|uniref:hypothetical protein n=1 Tax=Bradyrhizobium sp. McL0616 TaxID=3415674 RepID=UPI003CF3C5C3
MRSRFELWQENRQRGSLPFSLNLTGQAFRWHRKDRSHRGEDFWKNFQEGDWKWDGQQRFAGAGGNIAHYLSFYYLTAKKELAHYVGPAQYNEYWLLHILSHVDNVLNLTDVHAFSDLAAHFNRTGLKRELEPSDLLSLSLEMSEGGGTISNWIGMHAEHAGYNGVLYLSIRALPESDRKYITGEMNKNLFVMSTEHIFADPFNFNVAFFSGAKLITSIQKYHFSEFYQPRRQLWSDNPDFRKDPKSLSGFDELSREERVARTRFMVTKE